jgi:hypothetical protein
MYADDTVIFSETIEGLQDILNKLSVYCDKWKLTVNIAKTKIVVFKNGRLKTNECWSYRDQVIELWTTLII